MKKGSTPHFYEEMLFKGLGFLKLTVSELVDGISHERIDVVRYIYPGTFVAAFLVLQIDSWIARLSGLPWLEVPFLMRQVLVYITLFAGWFLWAGERALYRSKMLSRLTTALRFSGLIFNERTPPFISDDAIDGHVRRLRLLTLGLPIKKFFENRENLEAQLNVSITNMINVGGDKGRIDILYAMKPLTKEAVLENIDQFRDGEIPIGESFEGPISVNLRDVAHILVAGQTGGGKSNFEKVVTTVLTQNNPEAEVYYLDFKGGMELADLTNRLGNEYSNFHKFEGTKACASLLADFGSKVENRLQEIASYGVANLDDYVVKRRELKAVAKKSSEDVVRSEQWLKRTYIVIDEIAQLYARNPNLTKEELDKARDAVNRIARQGRASGLHLIIATQKPDASSFDQTVKANLPAVLCFPMSSHAASVSALGSKRSFDLNPEIKGRAVWKFGPKTEEVQTYLFQ